MIHRRPRPGSVCGAAGLPTVSSEWVTGSRNVLAGRLETGAPVDCAAGSDGVALIVDGRALRRPAVEVVLEIAIAPATAMRPMARCGRAARAGATRGDRLLKRWTCLLLVGGRARRDLVWWWSVAVTSLRPERSHRRPGPHTSLDPA
jgi:hypothetical protein